MGRFRFSSMYERFGEPVNFTMLRMNLAYCRAPRELVKRAEEQFAEFLLEFYQDEFLSFFEVDGHRKPESVFVRSLQDAAHLGFHVESYARGTAVQSKMDVRAFKQKLLSPE